MHASVLHEKLCQKVISDEEKQKLKKQLVENLEDFFTIMEVALEDDSQQKKEVKQTDKKNHSTSNSLIKSKDLRYANYNVL